MFVSGKSGCSFPKAQQRRLDHEIPTTSTIMQVGRDQIVQPSEKSMEESKARDRLSSCSSEKGNDDLQVTLGKVETLDCRGEEERSGCSVPIRSQTSTRHRPHPQAQTLRPEASYGGEDGYSCHHERNVEEGGQGEEETETDTDTEESRERKRWEVSWAGENDPRNPRSMSYARKWIIVFLISSSALCVYAVPTSMRIRERRLCSHHVV